MRSNMERRMPKLEGGRRKVTPKQMSDWVTRALDDPDWLEEQCKLYPGKPGSKEAEVNDELLAMVPEMRALNARFVPSDPLSVIQAP